jgi:hypothetical protein
MIPADALRESLKSCDTTGFILHFEFYVGFKNGMFTAHLIFYGLGHRWGKWNSLALLQDAVHPQGVNDRLHTCGLSHGVVCSKHDQSALEPQIRDEIALGSACGQAKPTKSQSHLALLTKLSTVVCVKRPGNSLSRACSSLKAPDRPDHSEHRRAL